MTVLVLDSARRECGDVEVDRHVDLRATLGGEALPSRSNFDATAALFRGPTWRDVSVDASRGKTAMWG